MKQVKRKQTHNEEIPKVRTGPTLVEQAIAMGKKPGRVIVANGDPMNKDRNKKDEWE